MTDIGSNRIEKASTTTITSAGLCSLTYTVTNGKFHRTQITLSPGASITLSAIKLEKGNTQTLAYKNKTATDEEATWIISDTPPNKEMELLKCIQAKPMTSSGKYKDAWSHHEIYHTGNKPSLEDLGIANFNNNLSKTLNINLLEEIENMEYCKVLTREEKSFGSSEAFFSDAIFAGVYISPDDTYKILAKISYNDPTSITIRAYKNGIYNDMSASIGSSALP
jgi:hypothetical protein